MVQIAIAPVSVGHVVRYFLFSRPDFVHLESTEETWTIALVDSQEHEVMSCLVDRIVELAEGKTPYLLAIGVMGDTTEAQIVFTYIDRMVGNHKDVNLYIDKPKSGELLVVRVTPPVKETLLCLAMSGEHNN